MNKGILAGFRVVEIAHPLTEFAGCLLAGLGADVYLIEPPGGSSTRQRQPRVPGAAAASTRASLSFLTRNTGKLSVVVDPARDNDRQLLTDLCARADVVLTADRAALHELVSSCMQHVTPQTAITITDDKALGVSSIVGFAASCGLSSSGWPHQPPCNAPGWLAIDGASIYAACLALIGTVAARRGAPPVHYEVPYEEAAVAAITPWTRPLIAYEREAAGQGIMTRRLGPGGFPMYPGEDGGYVRVVIGTPRQWDAFVALLGNPGELTSGPFSDPAFRRDNADALQLMCAELTKQFTTDELFHNGQRLGLTISPVSTLNAFRNDAHIRQRQFFITVEDPEFGPLELMRPPVIFGEPSLNPTVVPAPALGEHQSEAIAMAAEARPNRAPVDEGYDPLRPLNGLVVLDLGVGAVVPESAAMLAAFGAEVIKVESRANVDFLRRQGVAGPEDVDGCPTFNQLNLGVKSVALDMTTDAGRKLAQQLLAQCDIVMENMRGGVVAKWGLDYDRARKLRPDVLYLSSQGLGRGPYDGYQTYGPNLQTFSGVTGQWAHPDDPHPVGTTLNHPDHMAGKQALLSLLAGLLRREETGAGLYMEAAQVESAAYLIAERFLEQTFTAGDLAPLGNRSRDFSPHGCYPCRAPDRWVAIAVEDDAAWVRLLEVVGQTSLAASVMDAATTAAGRLTHAGALDAWLAAWTRERSVAEVEQSLRAAHVACSRVVTGDDLVAMDRLHDNGFLPTLDHARMGPRVYTGMPVNVFGIGRIPVERPPLLGEHTTDILARKLGLDGDTLARLAAEGAIGF